MYLKEAFLLYDQDHDGVLSVKEFKLIIAALGIPYSEEDLRDLISEIQAKRQGFIEYPIFLELMANKLESIPSEEQILKAFREFDKENTGFISSVDLYNIITNYGIKFNEQELYEMIQDAEIDCHGRVNYEEFAILWSSL